MGIDYKAEEIKRTPGEIIGTILYWIFPPTALWGLLKIVVNRLAGQAIGKLVLPATATQDDTRKSKKIGEQSPFEQYQQDRKAFENTLLPQLKTSMVAEELTLETPDGATLDTLQIRPQGNRSDIYIIKFCGNSGYYEKENILKEAESDANEHHCNFILFNYRGVGQSSQNPPRSEEELITDAITQARRLIDKGVGPEKIIFKGHSLGAAISTIAAERCHSLGWPVREYNSRSFATLADVLAGEGGWLRPIKKIFYASLLTLSKWKLDAATAYKKIPQTHKDYFCVRTSKAERKENQTDILSMLNSTQEEIIKAKIKDDVVIPHVASLHVGIREERATIKVKRRALKAKLKKIEGNETEAQELREQLEQLKQESNQHKMITERNNPEGHPDGHGAPTDKLISRATKSGEKPLTADDHFNTFFDRCTAGAAESKGSDPHSTTQKPTTN